MKRFSEALARFIERRPWWILLIVLAISGAAAPGVTLLEPETGFDAFVSPNSEIAQDNSRYEEQFGAEPITVLLEGQRENIFSSENLAILSEFEQEFSDDERYRSILSPVTLLQAAIEEASQAPTEQLQLMGEPSLDNPLFVASVLYDSEGEVSPAMQPLIPDDEHVLIIVTPQGNMDDNEALQAAKDIEYFFSAHPLAKVGTTVIADTKLVDAISTSLGTNMVLLLVLVILVMTLILVLLFRVRWRLLSLLMVGFSAMWTFGLMGYASVPLTMTTMAVLPILIGLGIDYSIQFQNRYQEEITISKSVGEAMVTSLSRMFPAVGIALLATIIGFITLYISEVPMIRDFGMILAIGIILSYIVALFLLHSIVYLGDRKTPIKQLRKVATEASGRIERTLSRVGKLAINHTLPIFIIALIYGIGGGVVDHWLPINTNFEELVPQDIAELQELRELREITGSGGEIRFMIEADDAASPEVLSWLQGYQNEALTLHPELVSVNSPATLVSEATGGVIPSEQQIEAILASTPSLYLDRVLSSDGTMASASFSINYISVEEVYDLLQLMEGEAQPPSGVQISTVGSLALGASTMNALVGARFNFNLICLGAVLVVLLLVYRRLMSVIFIIVPVGAVIGWSSLDMYLIGIPLNPLTAVLGVIIIGICTEFMVLLTGRYEEEKEHGLTPQDAMVTAISKIGRAIVTTALTTLGGFGVLIASNFVIIRDFGITTVLSVFLCLVITIAVMPGLIVWFDNWKEKRLAKKA